MPFLKIIFSSQNAYFHSKLYAIYFLLSVSFNPWPCVAGWSLQSRASEPNQAHPSGKDNKIKIKKQVLPASNFNLHMHVEDDSNPQHCYQQPEQHQQRTWCGAADCLAAHPGLAAPEHIFKTIFQTTLLMRRTISSANSKRLCCFVWLSHSSALKCCVVEDQILMLFSWMLPNI